MHTFTGVSASPGVVIGPVEQIDHGTTGLHRIVCDPFRERALYDVAVVLAKDELRRLSQRAKGPDADILLFQIALLEDESFTNEIGDYIAAGAGGAAAVERAEQIFARRLRDVERPVQPGPPHDPGAGQQPGQHHQPRGHHGPQHGPARCAAIG